MGYGAAGHQGCRFGYATKSSHFFLKDDEIFPPAFQKIVLHTFIITVLALC